MVWISISWLLLYILLIIHFGICFFCAAVIQLLDLCKGIITSCFDSNATITRLRFDLFPNLVIFGIRGPLVEGNVDNKISANA
jgi:hypothetical protein